MPIQDWGIALFNIDEYRSAITDHLNDREKFVLIETLKECDRTRISNEEVGDVREIAREFSKFMANFKGSDLISMVTKRKRMINHLIHKATQHN